LPDKSSKAELHRALGDIRELLEHPITHQKHGQLKSRLGIIASSSISQSHADLAGSLLRFVDIAENQPATSPGESRWWSSVRMVRRSIPSGIALGTHTLLAIGLLMMGLLMLKNPANTWLSQWLPQAIVLILRDVAGRHIDATISPFLTTVRLSFEMTLGFGLILSAGLLAAGRTRSGSALALVTLIISLATVNILLFYFEQFSSIITTSIQFLLVFVLIRYRRRLTPRAGDGAAHII
jgi:hypothetical protein